MTDTFGDLGIAPGLVTGAQDMGWNAPSPLQKDAVPVLRRGNNGVLHASTGAGVTGAWGLALLDRVASFGDDDVAPTAIVLAPDPDEVSRTAGALARLGAHAGVAIRALAPGWTTDRAAPVLVATPSAALAAVRDSALKLDAVAILVLAGADRMHALGEWPAVRTLTESMTGAAQKVVVTGSLDGPIPEFIEGHVRKALTIPARPADGAQPDTSGSLGYAVATGLDGKIDALVTLLQGQDTAEVAVVCRTEERAATVAAGLAARGVSLEGGPAADDEAGDGASAPRGPRVRVLPAAEADQRSTRAAVLSCDVPFDADALAALHGGGGAVLVMPAELPHLRRIAARAGLRLQPRALPRPGTGDAAEVARNAIRAALDDVDLAAYLALLQPLLEERPAAEVAAAALYLARNANALRGAGAASGSAGAAAPRDPARTAGTPAPSAAFVRLFLTIGSRDDVSPGDIVGAITGEAEVDGETVGRIDIRESHTTVEVQSTDADRVIRALNGRTLKGRSLRVDYDRKDRVGGSGGGAQGPAGGGAPRGGRSGPAGGSRPGGRKPGGAGGGPGGGGRGGPSKGGSRGGPSRGGPGRGGPGRGGARPPRRDGPAGPRRGGSGRSGGDG